MTKSAHAAATIRFAATWLRGGRRNVLIALGTVVVLSYAATQAWWHYGASHVHWEKYTVGIDQIHVNAPPPWVRADVKGDVARIGSLQKLSLLDRGATQSVAQAFGLHPWVAQVQRVSKRYPATIDVQVAYRKPVAVVEVQHAGQPGLLPIDRSGILLPPEDFSVAQVKTLPRIASTGTFPAGSVGTAWGDERITAAALLAEMLCDDWATTGLFQIASVPSVTGGDAGQSSFELVTREGRRFLWGRAPGREASGEKTSAEKRSRLLKGLSQPASGDDPVDLRT